MANASRSEGAQIHRSVVQPGQPRFRAAVGRGSGEAASGEEAVGLAADHTPDVILMDLVMPGAPGAPGMDGVEATRRVREVSPGSQVMVLTSFHDERIFPAIKAGAEGNRTPFQGMK